MSDHPPYIVALALAGRQCVVVGGGAVAERKARGLLASGAIVAVVAPAVTDGLRACERAGEIVVRSRPYERGDVAGAFLVVAATNMREINARVTADARAAGALVNVADAPEAGDFTVPATARRGGVTLAVSTTGDSPLMAALARDRLADALPDGFLALLEGVAALRAAVRAAHYHVPPHRWHDALTPDVLALADAGQTGAAMERVRAAIDGVASPPAPLHRSQIEIGPDYLCDRAGRGGKATPRTGVVSLVGAGPGDPGLLTVRARLRLRAADVVVYDRLLDPRILDEASPEAERIYVGKGPKHHAYEQEAINALLVTHGRAGKRVVRLKGGDPFVFGRGGEEADALVAADIPFEVVPGISSAIAVPAYAGIPVTHRGISASVTVVTGHEEGAGDWATLAGDGGTLVFLMGVGNLPGIAQRLLACGLPATTPAAAIEWGTWAKQRVVVGTVGDLPARVAAAGLGAPATVVIGEVVRLRERIQWFGESNE